MAPLAVLLVHGIGDQQPDWAGRIIERLTRCVAQEARALDLAVVPGEPIAMMAAVHWAQVLQGRQRLLRERLDNTRLPLVARPPWWHLRDRLRRWYVKRWKRDEHRLIAEFIGDVIGYPGPDAYPRVHATVAQALEALSRRLPGSGPAALTLIGHSLGAVIASDHIYDARKARQGRASGEGFHERFRLANFFTLGSPQALFSLKYGGPEAFKEPVTMETARGRWINILDPIDPIAMPLRGLNEAYAQAVWRDVLVDTGGWLDAHTRYLEHPNTLSLIARKLALDWAAAHGRLSPAALQAVDTAYAQALGAA